MGAGVHRPGWTRFPSALATSGTAALLVLLGWQLADRRTGLLAGLVFALLPSSSYHGAEARGYALAAMLSTAAAVLLVRATGRRSTGAWVAYGVVLSLAGWVFLFSALAVLAHAVWVLSSRTGRRDVAAFAWAAGGGLVLLVPLALVAAGESRQQIGWIGPLDAGVLRTAARAWSGSSGPVEVVLWVAALAGAVLSLRGRRATGLAVMAAALALVPSAVVLAASAARPVYVPRYVFGSIVGFCLLIGHALARLPRWTPLVGLTVVLAIGLPAQRSQRQSGAKGDQQTALASVLGAERRDGDAVLFARNGWSSSAAAYPAVFRHLRDVHLDRTPVQTGDYTGTFVSSPALVTRLRSVRRVWFWHEHLDGTSTPGSPAGLQLAALRDAGYSLTESHRGQATDLSLHTRR